MKNPTQLRQHVIDAIGSTLLGKRNYGTISEPSILVLPDPDLGGNGFDFPSKIDGNIVTYEGIEVIIYESYEGNQFTPMLAGESQLDSEIWVLVKAHNVISNETFTDAIQLISKGLWIKDTRTPLNPVGNSSEVRIDQVDQMPQLKSQILTVGFAGYR